MPSPSSVGIRSYRALPRIAGWDYLVATSLGRLPLSMVPLAVLTLVVAALALSGSPVSAAPGDDVTTEFFLRDLTLPVEGPTVYEDSTFYLTAEYDLTRVTEMRQAMVEMGDEYKVSVNDVLMKAVATALAQHPEVNAHWLGDKIREHNRVHLGMAVATNDGLIVPVIFDAHQKRMSEISAEARELAKKARERKLKPEEYTGSTFSIVRQSVPVHVVLVCKKRQRSSALTAGSSNSGEVELTRTTSLTEPLAAIVNSRSTDPSRPATRASSG